MAEGYLIERGKITTPVRGATLIGNGPEVLLNIDAIADDLEIKAGTCGKEGQHVSGGQRAADPAHPRTDGGRHEPGMSPGRHSGGRRLWQIARRALDRGARLGADLEVYFQAGRTASIKVFGGEVESISVAEPRGLGVRAMHERPGGLRLHGRSVRLAASTRSWPAPWPTWRPPTPIRIAGLPAAARGPTRSIPVCGGRAWAD